MGWRSPAPRGFTIVELIAVIVIIGILALLVMNTVLGSQGRARDAVRADDIHTIVNFLISYNTVHGGLPSPQNYGEDNTNGFDTSASGQWLPFLNGSANGKLPKDPINNETGDPTAPGATKYTYFYMCFQAGQSGNPNAAIPTARVGYRNEANGALKITDFTIEACLQ